MNWFTQEAQLWESPGVGHVGLFSLLSSQRFTIIEHQLSQTRWAAAHQPAVHNLPKSHYPISVFFFFWNSNRDPPSWNITLWGSNTLLADAAKLFDTDTHTQTCGWSSHREMKRCALIGKNKQQQQETGRRERDTQTRGSSASLSLPSPCWAWQLSAGSRSICLSLRLNDTQSTWFPKPLSPEVIDNGTTAISHYGESN